MLKIQTKMIAPCGMNCALCMAYLREKNRCNGCRQPNSLCKNCTVVSCDNLRNGFCTTKCEQFPCKRIKQLDKRYQAKYYMSMIENLRKIEETGIREFVKSEEKRWECKKCGGTICVHKGACWNCEEKITTQPKE